MADVDMAVFKRRLEMAVEAKFGSSYGRVSRLARVCDVSAQTASKWLKGDARPGAERLPTVAAALGVTPRWLLGCDDDTPAVVKAHTSEEAVQMGRAASILIPLLVRLDATKDPNAIGRLFVKVLELVRMQKNDHEIMGHIVKDVIGEGARR